LVYLILEKKVTSDSKKRRSKVSKNGFAVNRETHKKSDFCGPEPLISGVHFLEGVVKYYAHDRSAVL
jgi:hypothetical protein